MKLKLMVILLVLCISICEVSVDRVCATGNSGEDFTYDSETKTVTILRDLISWYFDNYEEIQSEVQKAVVSEGVTCLNNGCFNRCGSLKSVTLPVTLQYINNYAFDRCDGLEEIIYNGTIEEWSQIEIKEDNNDSLKNAVIHCTDGDTAYIPPERQYDYTASDIVKAEFFNVRDVIAGIDSYEMGIGANLTMRDGKTVYIDFGYDYEYDYSTPYGGLYELNRLKYSLTGGEECGGYVRFSTDSSNVDEDGEVVGTGIIPVTVSISELDIEYNRAVEMNAVENPVRSLAVMNSETRKISKETVAYGGNIQRTDILVTYSDSTQVALWAGIHGGTGWAYSGGSSGIFIYDHKLWNEQTVSSVLRIHGEKRHKVEYVLGKELEELKVGETYPLIIKYMGQEVTTYITVTENETDDFDYREPSGSEEEMPGIEPEPTQPLAKNPAQITENAVNPSLFPGNLTTVLPSGGAGIATQDRPDVPKVLLKTVKAAGKQGIKVIWKRGSGINGYQLQYATNKKFTKSKKSVTITSKKTSQVIKGLKVKKAYYVRIRAFRKASERRIYGKWSSAKRIKLRG